VVNDSTPAVKKGITPMFASKVRAQMILSSFVAILASTAWAPQAKGQDPDADTYFSIVDDNTSSAPCPNGFPAVYTDNVFGTFWGYSRLTMLQMDEYHTYKYYTYEFSGKTRDESTGVTGTHHVNAAQCTHAAYHYFFHIPAVIGLLHNPRFSSLACTTPDDPSGPGTPIVESRSNCEPTGGGGGGGMDPVRCWTLHLDHYWYYPSTGQLEYRYTETYVWCEESA
jgi:hypothetical protein